MKRLPFDDLYKEAGKDNLQRLAERLGCTARTLHRWKNDGVPVAKADRAAIALGSHPAYIWPEHWNMR